jgi:23S rRNA G2445 N2-methylase RlmL
MGTSPTTKDLYRQLRVLAWRPLWADEVGRFDRATPPERLARVAVIRAVGVVFAESGPAAQLDAVTHWLLRLLHDPAEKIRRYAMAALPKIGAGACAEAELLSIRRTTTNEREVKFLAQTLDKIGGTATLADLEEAGGFTIQSEQKIKASVARSQSPSAVQFDRVLPVYAGLRLHLRGRLGLEGIVREEVDAQGKFRVVAVAPGLVAITPLAPFSLADLFTLRCFGTAGFVLDLVKSASEAGFIEAVAAAIASPLSRKVLETFTAGSIRYRLDFVAKGHQRAAVRRIADRAYQFCPGILNDAREAPWAIDIHHAKQGDSVELRPRLSTDPRHTWRLDGVPAASHPPLAACMARLAGRFENEAVWDPFCGSGLELIERALLGGVGRVFGTDRSTVAIVIAGRNFAAAQIKAVEARFICCDFRDFARKENLPPGGLTLIITNPPLGRRVRIADLRGLFDDLFATAASLLAPGGRLVLTNPFRMESPQPSLQLQSRRMVDLGGFDCRLEMYRKFAG